MTEQGELLESRAVTHWIYTQSARGEPFVSIQTQAVILAQKFRSLQVYSLRANMKNFLGEYSLFFKPST